jgi:7-cyano-7-deazaguanine reductase
MSRYLPAWRPTFSGLFDDKRRPSYDAKRDAVKEAPAVMPRLEDLQEAYEKLDWKLPMRGLEAIASEALLAFDYEYPDQAQEIVISTDEFTAVCPWTGLPDQGRLTVSYVPGRTCVELKSLKYYLLSYRDVGIVQEHAAARILRDLVGLLQPRRMKVTLDYNVRGGLQTVTTVEHSSPVA